MIRRFQLHSLVYAMLLAVAGCASNPEVKRDGGSDIVTEYDATEAQKLAKLRLQLAAAYLEQGQATEALDSLKQALQADPNNIEAHNLRGLIYMRLNEPQFAEDSFKRALSLSTRNGDVYHNYGWLKCTQSRFDEAQGLFNQALAATGYIGHAKTQMAAGMCYQRAGAIAQAEQSYLRAYELDAGNPIVGYNLALLMYQKRDLQRAQFYVGQINRTPLANSQTLWLGVKVERRLGNLQGMRELGSRLQREHGGTQEATYYERGQFEQ